ARRRLSGGYVQVRRSGPTNTGLHDSRLDRLVRKGGEFRLQRWLHARQRREALMSVVAVMLQMLCHQRGEKMQPIRGQVPLLAEDVAERPTLVQEPGVH